MAAPFWQGGFTYFPGDIVQPVTAPAPNVPMVANGDFSAGASGWDYSGGAAYALDGHGYGGAGCVRLPGNTPDGLALNQTKLYVEPGGTLTASCMIEQGASAVRATAGWVEIHWFASDDTPVQAPDKGNEVNDGRGGAWHKSTVASARPAAASYARAGIHLTSVADHNYPIWGDALTVSGASAGLPAGMVYKAVQAEAGTSAANEPAWPSILGQQVIDGDVIWEAVTTSRITWTASPRYLSGAVEPVWPEDMGGMVQDGSINWRAVPRRVEDERCPNSKVVAILASKVFAADRDIVRFSATANPLDWSTAEDAGYLPTGLQQANANDMAVLVPYRKNLTAWNASSFQNWQADPDPASMAILDQMDGIGSTWPRAAVPVANDLFYLAALGVRSIGIANAAENLVANDVGTPIDPLVQQSLLAADANGSKVLATYYPSAGQYWLAFSEFPPSPLALSGNLPDGYVSDEGQYSYMATGGVRPYQFSVASGELPTGAALSSSGVVSYAYTTEGSFEWSVSVVDALGAVQIIPDAALIRQQPVFAAGSFGSQLLAGENSSSFDRMINSGVSGTLVESRNGRLFHIGSGLGAVSTDEGETFTTMQGIPSGAPAALLSTAGEFFLAFSVSTEVGFRSSDGITFSEFTLDTVPRIWSSGYCSGKLLIFGANGYFRRSIDGGTSWEGIAVAGMGIVRAIAGRRMTLIAVDGNVSPGTFRRSVDGGKTWAPVSSPYPGAIPAAVACSPDRFVVIFSNGQTAHSEDDGVTWQVGGQCGESMGSLGPQNELVYAGGFLAASRSVLIDPPALIYRSVDGDEWTPVYRGEVSEVTSITPLRSGQ